MKEKLGSQSPEENLVELVKNLWDKMLNPEDSSFPMTDAAGTLMTRRSPSRNITPCGDVTRRTR